MHDRHSHRIDPEGPTKDETGEERGRGRRQSFTGRRGGTGGCKKKRGRGRGRGRGCGRVSKKPAAKAPPEPGICKRPAQAPSSSARPSKKTKPTGEVAEETKSGASKLDSWPNSGSDIFENDVGFGCHCQ